MFSDNFRMRKKAASLHANVLVCLVLVLFVPFGVLYKPHICSQQRSSVREVVANPHGIHRKKQQQQQQQQPQQLQKSVTTALKKGNQTAVAKGLLPNVTLQYFPQAKRCKAGWVQQYAAVHHDILTGRAAPRYLVSVTAGTGLADKLVGTMTALWHAVLTDRALSVVTYPGDPGLSDVCETGLFDWTQTPAAVKQDAIDSLRPRNLRVSVPPVFVTLPKSYHPSTFQAMQLHNKRVPTQQIYSNTSLARDPAYLLLTTNRGRTYALVNNPHYKQRFQAMGVPATDAFMCGLFFFCSPVAAVQQYYQKYWDLLSEPGVLRIGIQVRSGDKVIEAEANGTAQQRAPQDVLKSSSHFFKCAERLEAAFAAPGQNVIWFLNSDSQAVRQAAKAVYGDKLLTDDSLQTVHPERGVIKQDAEGKLKWALQHALGSILTFSMTDLQVITQTSGFGRTGAWLAERRDRMYELHPDGAKWNGMCNPKKPKQPAVSSKTNSGI